MKYVTLFKEALQSVKESWSVLIKHLWLPGLSLVAVDIVEIYVFEGGFIFSFVKSAIYTIIAVITHRIVLLGDNSVVDQPIIQWTDRETRFFLCGFIPWIIVGVISILILLLYHR